jgi:hypothetical protein
LQAGLEHGAQSIERPTGGQLAGTMGCHENGHRDSVLCIAASSLSGSADRSSDVIEFFPKIEAIMRVSRDSSHAPRILPKSQSRPYAALQELRTTSEGVFLTFATSGATP